MHKLYFAEMLSCRSGTEEEYTERDQLLQDIISLLQGTSYKIRLARRRTTNSAATPHPPNGAAAARKAAVAARDAAASSYAAPVHGGDVGSPDVSPGTSSKCSLTVMQRLSMHHANMSRQVSFDKPCLQALARRPRQPKSSMPCFWTPVDDAEQAPSTPPCSLVIQPPVAETPAASNGQPRADPQLEVSQGHPVRGKLFANCVPRAGCWHRASLRQEASKRQCIVKKCMNRGL